MFKKKTLSNIVLVVFSIFILSGLYATNEQDLKADEAKLLHYCDMVTMYRLSGGEYGWPDFDRIYKTECKK